MTTLKEILATAATAQNKNLHAAKKNKNDEFYTQISDIEKELLHYREHLKDKVIFCNCDDPEESMFWRYFSSNFEFLKLKKLIATHFDSDKPSYKLELMLDVNDDGKVNGLDTIKTPLLQNGDFRSPECIELLKEADIICTNPPFSLFREYIAQLIEYEKSFLIIGNVNATSYKEIFPLIKENKLWWGISPRNMTFTLPDGSKKQVNANWYTNLPHKKRNEELILYKKYEGNEHLYPKYDNYDAIEVSKVTNIPIDYTGVMGVPITFLDKYNSEQFEILGISASAGYNKEIVGIPMLVGKDARPLIYSKNTYARIFIKRKII